MSRFFLFLALLLVSLSFSSAQLRNAVQLLDAPTTIPRTGAVSVLIEWETNYVGPVNVHFDISDLSANYAYYGGTAAQVIGPGSGTQRLTATITSPLNLGDIFQLHAYLTPNNYTTLFGIGNDWNYSWANTYPLATVSTSLTLTNSMTLLYPPSTVPLLGYVAFDVAYTTGIPSCTLLHIDFSDTTSGWAWDGGQTINVTSPGSGVVQFNFSVSNLANNGAPLTIGDVFDVNMYMVSCADSWSYGAANEWLHKNYTNTGTTVAVAAATSFWDNVALLNVPSAIPVSGTFTVQVQWSTNRTGQIVVHCDVNDGAAPYTYYAGNTVQVTGPGTGLITMTLNVSSVVATPLNTSHLYNLHTYLLDEMESQSTGGYSDYLLAKGSNLYTGILASKNYATSSYGDYITLLNPPTQIPNTGTLELTVEWESSAIGSTSLRIDLTDTSPYQNYAWGGGAYMTVNSPGAGVATLQLSIVNGTLGLLNQLDLWQFHVYTVSAANMTACATSGVWNCANAQQYVNVAVSNSPIINYAAIVNPPTLIPQTGTINVDLYYISNLQNQTVIHLDLNDISQGWKWFTGASTTVKSPSSGTVRFTLTFPASLNLTVGDNLVLQYYLTSIYNATVNPGLDWQDFNFEDRIYVQVTPANSFVNFITPVNPPSQIPSTGSFSLTYQYSTSINGLANLHVDVSDVTTGWSWDGGAMIQVEGPSQGTVIFTITLGSTAVVGDNIALHAYITDNAITLLNGGTSRDYLNVSYETFNYVSSVSASNYRPFVYSDSVILYRPPTTIPQSGTIEVVVLWSSSAVGSTLVHCDLSDIDKSYAWDGGYTQVVASPGSGTVVCQISIVNAPLTTGDRYQIHAYTVSNANHTLHPGNEYSYVNAEIYQPVVVTSSLPVNQVILQSPPLTIPTVGSVTFDLTYTSVYAGSTVLHLDLNDVTLNYRWYTGNTVTVPSPGSGTVPITLTFTSAMNLAVGDIYTLKAYMTSIANATADPGNDWKHSGYDNYNAVSVAAPGTFINAISPLYSPVAIPTYGTFSATYQYSTNISGLVDLHLDLSDTNWNYITGSATAQVSGPSQGTYTFTISTNTTAMTSLTVGTNYYLHAYMAAETDGIEYGVGNDWMRSRGDSIITVPAATPATLSSSQLPYSIVFYQNPGTIPQSGTIEWVVEWSSPAPTASVLHIDLSDVSRNYSWGGGASLTRSSPGRGFATLQIPIVGTLNAGDVWQAHAYITTVANATADPGNDWKHSMVDVYLPVVVSSAPLTNYMAILNPPSTIPTVGTVTLEVFYITNCANYSNLHMDLSDVTLNWLYEAGSMVTVPSPGTGTVQLSLTATAAMAMKVGDQFDLHLYSACPPFATATGSLDWNNTAFNSVATTVYVAAPGTFINSLKPVSAPYYIPNTGNFTVNYAWSCNITGSMNFHVDLSDSTTGWTYEGGATVQANCPASGISPFTIAIQPAKISVGDTYYLHAYMAPTDTGLIYGTGQDWAHSVWDGFTVVQAVVPGTTVANTLSFVNPVAIIPQSGSFYVTVAYTSALATMSNIHVDLSDVTQNWKFEVGSLTQVTSPGSGQIRVLLTVPASLNLNPGDVYQLHAYMASIANATQYGNSTDWQHSAADAYSQVTVISGGLYNQMTIINPPTTIANTGTETFQLIWSSPTNDLLNLHCDLSDITQLYAYEGGSYLQVQGPGSGLVNMAVPLSNANGGGPLKIGDNYTLHCYMTNATTTAAVGGTSNDWKFPQFQSYYNMVVASATSFTNNMSLLTVPSTVPTSGNFTVQVVWSSNIPGETNLHLDLSDVSAAYSYDGGATQVVTSPGSGIVTMNIVISASMPSRDQYELHAYMAPTANSSSWGGAGQDWAHATFEKVWLVSAASSGSGSKSSLSGGAIAGIVIGSVVGAALLIAVLVAFICCGARGGKGKKYDNEPAATGSHMRHNDEPSQVPSSVEMGETHEMGQDEGEA